MSDERAERYKLLLVDDDREFLEDAIAVLEDKFECVGVGEAEEVLSACDRYAPDAVLLDLDFHGEPKGFEVLPSIKKQNPYLPVIIWTETEDVHARLKAQNLGAFFYVHKAARAGDMLVVLDAAFKSRRAQLLSRGLLAELDREWGDLVYASSAMAEIVDTARRAAASDEKVLITGKTGVGKGVIAYEIHRNSARASEQFVVVECAGITESLADNELFGHEKGAFTGAGTGVDGVCRAAHKGTLFLDEIGDMPYGVQAKIRRMLEDGHVRRVGGKRDIPVDARIIAATNRDLEKEVEEGRFRDDLFYRLNVIRIHIPPLSEHRDDIMPLALHFMGRHRTPEGEPYELSPDAAAFLEANDWPGNVRQLKHAIDRACTLSPGPVITSADFTGTKGEVAVIPSFASSKEAALEKVERECVVRALAAAQTVTGAADLLQVSKSFVHSVIKRRGIREEEWKKPK